MKKVVISLSERRLYFYQGNRMIRNYPVAIGKESTPTPTGQFSITHKLKNPGGPFGTRWMSFKPHYGIHGTNQPGLIGKRVSLGCVRMFNQDVEELYNMVGIGTKVEIIAEPL